jgi:hypothetical protein
MDQMFRASAIRVWYSTRMIRERGIDTGDWLFLRGALRRLQVISKGG